MIYGYLTDDSDIDTQVTTKMVQMGKHNQRQYFVNERRILSKDINMFKCKCDVCDNKYTSKPELVTRQFKLYDKNVCPACGANDLHLSSEEKKQKNDERLRKQEITKTKNKSRIKDKVNRGERWGVMVMDQSTGSEVREKMNNTKQQNNTFGHSGTPTRDKMNKTMKENKTDQKSLPRGWNKWSVEQRQTFNEIYKPGFLAWSDEERLNHNRNNVNNMNWDNAIKTRQATQIKNGTIIDPALLSEWQQYHRDVWKITNKQPLHTLTHYDKRGRIDINENAYHLDHMFSISQGFKDKIPAEVVGSLHNLKFIKAQENSKKQDKCSITKEELFERYYS